MSQTYAGTTIAVVAETPAANTQAGFEALAFVSGECALRSIPAIFREWTKVTDDLACAETNTDVKGSAKWSPVTFMLTRISGDAAQAIYDQLEESRTAIGSFRMMMPGQAGTIYFTAQVSKFALADGGSKDTIHAGSVELLIQTRPVYVPAATA